MIRTLTQQRLKELFSYDQNTGEFMRISDGAVVAMDNGVGYMRVRVDGALYYSHRLAWLFMTGQWPKDMIDHVNGNKSDNRWSNLREATQRENSFNQRIKINNTSGFKGVSFSEKKRKYRAYIALKGKQIHLGWYKTAQQAAEVYNEAAREFFGLFAKVAAIVCFVFLSAVSDLRAQDGYHGQGHSQWHGEFYQRLVTPDTRVSCCSLADCRPTQGKQVGDHWEVMIDGKWVRVLDSKIVKVSAPDGGVHVCAPVIFDGAPEHVYCVVLPPEG